jgi:hypothetical protein
MPVNCISMRDSVRNLIMFADRDKLDKYND